MISDEMMTGYDIYKDLELIEAGKRKTMSDSPFTIKKALSAPAEGAFFTFEKVVPAA